MKAQVALEFLLMFIAIASFSLIMIGMFSYVSKNKIEEKNNQAALNILKIIEKEILLSTKMQNGYYKEFKIPKKINNDIYNISINNSELKLMIQGKQFIKIIQNISGDIKLGTNTIRKKNDIIYLNI